VESGFDAPLGYASALLKSGPPPDGARPIEAAALPDALLANCDLLIFDFSLDDECLTGAPAERVTDWPRHLRHSLGAVARCLEACAGRAGAGGARVPDFLVINANHHVFRNFAGQFLLLTETPYATHVRKGRPRLGEECLYRSNAWKYTEDDLRSFFGYDVEDDSVPPAALDESIDLTSAGRPARFKDGHWGATDYTGSWTDGHRAAFVFQPPPADDDVVVSVRVNEAFIGPEGDPIRVEVLLDGVRLARWSFFSRYEPVEAKATIPAALLSGKAVCRLEFHVENPQSAALVARAQGQQVIGDDPRLLGFKVQRITFRSRQSLRYQPGQALDFTVRGTGAVHANECWSLPDEFGVWTFGPRSALTLLPARPIEGPAQAIVTIDDVALSGEHPTQNVRVLFDGRPVANWTLGPAPGAVDCRVLLPAGALRTGQTATLAFQISTPRTPAQQGFRLSRLRIAPIGPLKYRLGENIDFVEGGDSLLFVGDTVGTEWSQPGPRGSWTLGGRASFRVPFEEPASGDLPAAFVVSDCAVSSLAPQLPVIVRANGRPVAEWVLNKRRPHRQFAVIPGDVVAAAPELTLTFEIAGPQSPESLGSNADPRPLGFQLARAVIGRSQVAIPKFKAGRGRITDHRILRLPRRVARLLAERYRP
jgi:hypothetical protein